MLGYAMQAVRQSSDAERRTIVVGRKEGEVVKKVEALPLSIDSYV